MNTLKILAVALIAGMGATATQAEPLLQLYVEGGSYNATTESWEITSDTFTLWVVGWTTSPRGNLNDVKLSFGYDSTETFSATLTSTTTDGLSGFTDPSTPGAASFIQTVADGSVPSALSPHGIYGSGTTWTEYGIGDFTLADSPIADFQSAPPSPGSKFGQINAYDIVTSGVTDLHIDAYGTYGAASKTIFAPYSHDADGSGGGTGDQNPVPEPGTFALLGIAAGAGYIIRRRRRS